MAKNNKRRNATPAVPRHPATDEDRRSEAITVGWMLTMLATTLADILALAAFALVPLLTAGAEDPGLAPILPRLLLLIAAVTGAVCVLITPAVYRFRQEPPPLPITVFGLVVSIAPVVAIFWRAVT